MTQSLVEIVTTVSSEAEAAQLARGLVESGVVACATFFPVRSIYPWKGEICDETEFQLVCKTLAARAADAEARMRELHPYQTPAVLRVPVSHANEEYVAWAAECLRGPAR